MIYKVIISGKNHGNHTAPGWNDKIAASARHPLQGARMERDFVMVCANAIRMQLKDVKIKVPVSIRYVFYEADRRRDLGNIDYIDKPFCDALQVAGYLKNDGQNEIKKLTFELGETDKKNPRIEIFVEEITENDGL
jgi:Holliday junction resolvase RusA-like endonuclease